MERKKDYRYIAAVILDTIAGFVLWVILICLKAAGVVTMHWALVLSGLVWLTWIMFVYTALVAAIVHQIAKVKRCRRRRKADARIIAQAKAAGVWDKRPTPLGGRALELKAWEDFKIKREPGEPDAHLRRRCMTAADNELASTPTAKEERHDEIDAYMCAIRSHICGVFQIPPEILCGESKKDTQDKGENSNE